MKTIIFLIKKSKYKFALSTILALAAGLSCSSLVALIHKALKAGSANSLLPFFIAVILIYGVCSILSEYLLISLSERILADFRIELCNRVLSTPLKTLEKVGTAKIFGALTVDVNTIIHTISMLPLSIVSASIVLGCEIYLAYFSFYFFCANLIIFLSGLVFYVIPYMQARNKMARVRRNLNVLFKHFEGLTQGVKELLLNKDRKSGFLQNRILTTSRYQMKQNIRVLTLFQISQRVGEIWAITCICLLLFITPYFSELSFGQLTGFILVFLFLLTPLINLVRFLPQLAKNQVALSNIEQLGLILSDHTLVENPGQNRHVPSENKTQADIPIILEDVKFEYRHGADFFTLGPVSLSLNKGELIFLVGGNGSGKTTLAKLICGLYVPQAGCISINGASIDDDNRQAYQQQFSVVFSDCYQFEALDGFEADDLDDQCRHHLDRFRLSKKVQVKNGIFSTVDLSHGQRKRLSLLTALLENRSFYIFDELAAAQDPNFKKFFYETLLAEMKANHKTTIVITHDDHYFHVADRIIKMEDGCIDTIEIPGNKSIR